MTHTGRLSAVRRITARASDQQSFGVTRITEQLDVTTAAAEADDARYWRLPKPASP